MQCITQWRRLQFLLVRVKNGAPKEREIFCHYLFMRGVAKN